MADTLFAVDDAAQRLNLKPATLRLFIRQKRVQGVKIGRRVKVAQSELERILRQGIAANGAAQALQAAPTIYPPAFPASSEAEAVWQQMTTGKKGDHNAAILRLANAPAEVRAIVAQRSAAAAAAYYATPEGEAELADWRALDGEPFHDDAGDYYSAEEEAQFRAQRDTQRRAEAAAG
jgi:excisionase family DNA binding protein